MKEFFISDCPRHENKVITSSFVVASKQVKAKKSEEPYQSLQEPLSAHDPQAAPHAGRRNRLCRLPAQDNEGHRRALADAGRLCSQLPEPAPEGLSRAVHGRPRDCRALPQRPRREIAASRLHRRPTRSRRVAVPLLRSGVPELSASES